MKTRLRIALLIVVAAATFLLYSCADKPVSIEDRIADFITSLNGDRSDTYTNLNPSTAAYSTAKDPNFWDAHFDKTKKPFTYSPNPPVTSTPTDVEITITDSASIPVLYQFVMVNIGTTSDNWVINDIKTLPGGASIL